MSVKLDIDENSIDSSTERDLLGDMDEAGYESAEGSPIIMDTTNSENHFKNITAFDVMQVKVTQEAIGQPHSSSQGKILVLTRPSVYGIPTESPPGPSIKVLRAQSHSHTENKKLQRDEKKRATHNEVERRRRGRINDWITKLGALVPNSGDVASKGGILARACDYITQLTEKQSRMTKIENERDRLLGEVLRLNQIISELRNEQQMARNNISASNNSDPSKGQKS